MQQQLAALETKIAQLNKEADSYFALRSAIDLGAAHEFESCGPCPS